MSSGELGDLDDEELHDLWWERVGVSILHDHRCEVYDRIADVGTPHARRDERGKAARAAMLEVEHELKNRGAWYGPEQEQR